jgi:hypothetical protein
MSKIRCDEESKKILQNFLGTKQAESPQKHPDLVVSPNQAGGLAHAPRGDHDRVLPPATP